MYRVLGDFEHVGGARRAFGPAVEAHGPVAEQAFGYVVLEKDAYADVTVIALDCADQSTIFRNSFLIANTTVSKTRNTM